MMNQIFSIFGLNRTHLLLTIATQILNTFEQNMGNDANLKNQAIDSIIELLKAHKYTQIVPIEPPKPSA